MTCHINNAGIALIKHYVELHLDAHLGPEGQPAIGYGHSGRDVRLGQHITEGEANRLLAADLAWVEDSVSSCVKVSLNENEFSALVSLVFNIGVRHFASSSLLKRLNKGEIARAAEAMTWLDDVNVALPGFAERREAEKTLFLRPIAREE